MKIKIRDPKADLMLEDEDAFKVIYSKQTFDQLLEDLGAGNFYLIEVPESQSDVPEGWVLVHNFPVEMWRKVSAGGWRIFLKPVGALRGDGLPFPVCHCQRISWEHYTTYEQ